MIKLNKKIDDIFFDVNTAIPCGLIINELVTNSLKHAFSGVVSQITYGRGSTNDTFVIPTSYRREFENDGFSNLYTENKEIKIELHQAKNNFVLIISDSGIGLPKNLNFKNTESLGLRLVNNLVKQLDGTITLDRTGGTTFKIIFKELKYKERI